MKAGKLIKQRRKAANISLRKFASLISVDPSNWSKVERGILPFSMNKTKTAHIAKALGIKKSGKEMLDFMDSLAISQSKIPDDIVKEQTMPYSIKQKFKEIREEVRISAPGLKPEKFRNMLLYVLENCSGKPNVGETVLHNLLYFIDFNYYEIYEEQLSGASYRKLDHGPVPFKIDKLLSEMESNEEILLVTADYFGFPQKRFIPLVKPDLTKLKASEKDVIDKTLYQLSDMNAKNIEEYSREDIPIKATKDSENIDYELVLYRVPPYSQRIYKEKDDGIS